jgi:hypothetical protein
MSLPALTLPATVPTLSGMVREPVAIWTADGWVCPETFKADAEVWAVVHSRVINTKGNPKYNGG